MTEHIVPEYEKVVDPKIFADCIFLYPDLSGGTIFSLLFRTNSHINVFPLPLCTDTENSSHKTFLILKLHQVKKVVRCSNITQYSQITHLSKVFKRSSKFIYKCNLQSSQLHIGYQNIQYLTSLYLFIKPILFVFH